jgi:hypothetical protein
VVSDAIHWVPDDWQVPSDDTGAIARAAQRLIHDAHAVNEGQARLWAYVANGALLWTEYLIGCRDGTRDTMINPLGSAVR